MAILAPDGTLKVKLQSAKGSEERYLIDTLMKDILPVEGHEDGIWYSFGDSFNSAYLDLSSWLSKQQQR